MPRLSSGIDIISVSRIRRLSGKPAFLKKVFTAGELEYAGARRLPHRHLAGRFAAKEAVMKALGTGWGGVIGWKDIEVLSGGGSPRAGLRSGALRLLGGRQVFLSISYSGDLACAMAVIE